MTAHHCNIEAAETAPEPEFTEFAFRFVEWLASGEMDPGVLFQGGTCRGYRKRQVLNALPTHGPITYAICRAVAVECSVRYHFVYQMAVLLSRYEVGEVHPNRKLPATEDIISMIRSGVRPARIARQAGVSRASVHALLKREGYSLRAGVVTKINGDAS
ncbi:helix-turn-helix transcriptional regulator [Devosia sp. Leaf64]|uniref:helix-turn-helix domain-containing protein n=1 Tax=Devosia sp. Leaf64 TaxID=1736229 RepID=UPI0007150D2E|nr:helix-turn-helix transcriptional regulator [Devosia sp. Leaf64]KQN75036.1 hypothetical protein ASE94_01575 [Devosia sp. Leaf64]